MRITLLGYFGFDNLGDEAILSSQIAAIRATKPDSHITVLSKNPTKTAKQYKVSSIHRFKLWDVIQCLRHTDLFILGGGSLLQNITSNRVIPYYLGLSFLAKKLGAQVVWYAQGLGPLLTPSAKKWVLWGANQADRISLRDTDSIDLLKQCGYSNPIRQTIDPVLKPILSVPQSLPESSPVNTLKIGLSLRHWNTLTEKSLKALTGVLAQIAPNKPVEIVLLALHEPDDRDLLTEVAAIFNHRPDTQQISVTLPPPVRSVDEMYDTIANLDWVFGMRLHALIIAAKMGTPAVGLVYDPKIASFCKQVGFECVESIQSLENIQALQQTLTTSFDNRLIQKQRLILQQQQWDNAIQEQMAWALNLSS
jgi:polysaccharide pyruvyl transferase CsaB